MERVIIIKYSEIGLKRKNRTIFEDILIRSIKSKTGYYRIRKTHGRIYIYALNNLDKKNISEILNRLAKTYGVSSVCTGLKVMNNKKEIENATIILLREEEEKRSPKTFKVNTRRINKRFSENSYGVSSYLGDIILNNFPHMKVDLKKPDLTINVEIREKTYIYIEELRGPGGLPVPSSGNGLLLLSGGIDSPVAGYLMGKRGLQVDAIYYHSPRIYLKKLWKR